MATLKTIQVYYSQPEAAVAKSMLDAHGVMATLPDFYHSANAWHHTFALQGIRLCTLDCEAAIATQLLEAPDDFKEPKTRATIRNALLALIFWFGFGVPYPVRQRTAPDRS